VCYRGCSAVRYAISGEGDSISDIRDTGHCRILLDYIK
jgi:hypothetical protein